jgi:GT2 family glycosyltransferase
VTGLHLPVSAAVAACDRPAGLIRCLDGIFAGEALPAEVIVVDQSSDAKVADALAAMPERSIPVRYVRQPRRGLSASRNGAIDLASQGMLAFTDDDCVPSPDWLATVHRVLAGDPEIAVVTGRVLPLGDARPGTYVVSPRRAKRPRVFQGRAVPWAVGTGGNLAARREWLSRVHGFDERLGAGSPGRAAEDAELLYRLLLAGAVIRYEPTSLVYHERQTAAQRLASRQGYGHGIGALCALYLRRGDAFPCLMLGSYLGRHGVELARALAHRDWFMARQRLLALGGCASGLRYGLGLR